MDKNTAEFSDTDLKAFTDLIKDEEDYDTLIDGFKDQNVIDAIQALGR